MLVGMPELPEVERGRRIALQVSRGHRIVEARCADDSVLFERVLYRWATGRAHAQVHRGPLRTVVTVLGLQLGMLIAGAVITEYEVQKKSQAGRVISGKRRPVTHAPAKGTGALR
jgi:hypothetical protein